MTILLTNLGLSSASPASRVGFTAYEVTCWISGSSLLALTAFGLKTGISVITSVGETTGSQTQSFTFDNLFLDVAIIRSTNIPKAGVALDLSFIGHKFSFSNFSPRVIAGLTFCETSRWYSDSCISCRAPQGTEVQGIHLLSAVIMGMTVAVTKRMSYDALSLSGCQMANANTRGRFFLTVHGSTFGIASYTQRSMLGFSVADVTIWGSDSICIVKAATGMKATLHIVLTSGLLKGTVTLSMSYDRLLINLSYSNDMIRSIVHVKIQSLQLSTVVTRLGATTCQESLWTSETSLMCKYGKSIVASLFFVVTSGVRTATLSDSCSFDTFVVVSLQLQNVATNPSIAVKAKTVLARAVLARTGFSSSSRAGESACEDTGWVTQTSVYCKTALSQGVTKNIVVTTGQQVASLSEAFSLDAIIVKINPCFFNQEQAAGNKDVSGMDGGDLVGEGSGEGASAGLSHGQLRSVARVRSFIGCTAIAVTSNLPNREPAKVSFLGYGMGWQSVETRVGSTACESSDWKSATSMQGFISGAMRGCAMLVLTAGIQTSSTSSGHSFDAAVLSSSRRQNAHGILSGSLIIIGFGYGFTDHTVKAGMTNTRHGGSCQLQCSVKLLGFPSRHWGSE